MAENGVSPVRRSTRTRKSRTTTVDGYTVLRGNNYSLEEGMNTISGGVLASAVRDLPPVQGARSAFIMFCNHNRKRLVGGQTSVAKAQRILSTAYVILAYHMHLIPYPAPHNKTRPQGGKRNPIRNIIMNWLKRIESAFSKKRMLGRA